MDPAAHAGGPPPNLDEFINRPVFNSGAYVEDVDIEPATGEVNPPCE
jgi:hypothetical protein